MLFIATTGCEDTPLSASLAVATRLRGNLMLGIGVMKSALGIASITGQKKRREQR